MKILAFLRVSTCFGNPVEPAQFIDFWTENDIFALQIQMKLASNEQASFMSNYNKIRKVMEFYQDSGDCDYFFQNPSFDAVDERKFDANLGPSENVANLVKNVDDWINSYSCVGLFGDYRTAFRDAVLSLKNLAAIVEDPDHQTPALGFTLSSVEKDYYAAMAHCFLKNERLAEIDSDDKIDYLEGLLPQDERVWVVGSHKCTTREKGAGETDDDCNAKHKFVCARGTGSPPSTTTTTTTAKVKFIT